MKQWGFWVNFFVNFVLMIGLQSCGKSNSKVTSSASDKVQNSSQDLESMKNDIQKTIEFADRSKLQGEALLISENDSQKIGTAVDSVGIQPNPNPSALAISARPLPRPKTLKPPQPVIPKIASDKEATTTGLYEFDQILSKQKWSNDLPVWFGYPWANIPTPVLWTQHLVQELKSPAIQLLSITPKDAHLYCPNFSKLTDDQRIAFWVRLVSILVEQESTFDPLQTVHSHEVEFGLFSNGLLMLSIKSSKQKRFGCSMIEKESDLFFWRKNMSCALRILNYLVKQDLHITSHTGKVSDTDSGRWMGLARYWEPFRDNRLKTPEGQDSLVHYVKQNRKSWLKEGQGKFHPAYFNEDHTRSGENVYSRALRLMNQMQFCPTGSDDDFEERTDILPRRPLPRPRQKSDDELSKLD